MYIYVYIYLSFLLSDVTRITSKTEVTEKRQLNH